MQPRLKCLPCTDTLITGGGQDPQPDQLPDAITMAPLVQTFTMGGQQLTAPLMVPVCFTCRQQQLGIVSKTGLITA